jgi:polyisoprenyl-phosphate glycosyltransferase
MSLDASDTSSNVELSIIVAMHNEQEVISLFFERLLPVLHKLTQSYEILCINDGSEDRTLEILRKIGRKIHM